MCGGGISKTLPNFIIVLPPISSGAHAGESHSVPREGCCPVWRSSIVDHPGGGSGWHFDVGIASVSTLEGRHGLPSPHIYCTSITTVNLWIKLHY